LAPIAGVLIAVVACLGGVIDYSVAADALDTRPANADLVAAARGAIRLPRAFGTAVDGDIGIHCAAVAPDIGSMPAPAGHESDHRESPDAPNQARLQVVHRVPSSSPLRHHPEVTPEHEVRAHQRIEP